MFAAMFQSFNTKALPALVVVLIALALLGVGRFHASESTDSNRVLVRSKPQSPSVDGLWLGMSPDLVEQRLGTPPSKTTTLSSYGVIIEYGYGVDRNSPRVRFVAGQGARSIQGKSLEILDCLFRTEQSLAEIKSSIGEPTHTRVMRDPNYRVDHFSTQKLTVFSCDNRGIEFSLSEAEGRGSISADLFVTI